MRERRREREPSLRSPLTPGAVASPPGQVDDERKAVIKGTVSFQTEAGGEMTGRVIKEAMIQTGMTLPPDLVRNTRLAAREREWSCLACGVALQPKARAGRTPLTRASPGVPPGLRFSAKDPL